MKNTIFILLFFLFSCYQNESSNDSINQIKIKVWEWDNLNKTQLFQNGYEYSWFHFDSLGVKYGIADVLLKKDSAHLILFYKCLGEYSTSDSIYLMDAFIVNKLNGSFIGGINCRKNMVVDKGLICTVKVDINLYNMPDSIGEKNVFNHNVIKAWRADIEKEKLYEVDALNIDFYALR